VTGFFTDHLNLDTVVAYVDGELSMVAFQRAAAHVVSCPQCAAEVDVQASARNSLRSASSPSMPSSLTAALCSIPVGLPAAGRAPGIAVDSVTGHAIRVTHVGRDVTRSRRLRLGAGALVVGIAAGAFATASAPVDETPTSPPGGRTVLPAAHQPGTPSADPSSPAGR
jgi:anti-sigma factor RsiW